MTVSALLTVPGILLIAGGVVWGGIGGTVLAALGTTLISIGVLSILYDALLKDVLLAEVYSAMGLSEQVKSVDLKALIRNDEAQLQLGELLADSTDITVAPLDPVNWSTAGWPLICDHLAANPGSVVVFLPAHDGPHLDLLAARLGTTPEQLSLALAKLPQKLGASWDEAGETLSASTMTVRLYQAMPAAGVIATESRIMLEIPPPLSYPTGNRRAAVLWVGRAAASTLIADLLDGQFEEARVPGFSQSIVRPKPDEVTPDPPPISDLAAEGQHPTPASNV